VQELAQDHDGLSRMKTAGMRLHCGPSRFTIK
jgi:hypothetical protein